jgi:hypothetical protein
MLPVISIAGLELCHFKEAGSRLADRGPLKLACRGSWRVLAGVIFSLPVGGADAARPPLFGFGFSTPSQYREILAARKVSSPCMSRQSRRTCLRGDVAHVNTGHFLFVLSASW